MVGAAEAGLLFQAINVGVDKIPEKHLEKIPYYNPNKSKDKDRSRDNGDDNSSNNNNNNDDRNDRRDDRYDDDRTRQRSLSPTSRHAADGPSAQTSDFPTYPYYAQPQPRSTRGYRQPDFPSYYPPNDREPLTPSQDQGPRQRTQSIQYDRQRYIPPPASMGSEYYPPPPPRDDDYAPRRYNPADYQPRQDSYGGNNGYGREHNNLALPSSRPDPRQRPSSVGPPSQYQRPYDDPYGSYDPDDGGRGRSDRRHHHKKDESRSPSRGIGGAIHKNLDPTSKGLAAGAVGALAGGWAGHHFGKGPMATAVGAVIGGFGANAWEAREARHKADEHRKEKEMKMGGRSRSHGGHYSNVDSETRRDLEYYGNRDRGRGGDDDYGSGSDSGDDRSRRRDRRRRSRGSPGGY